MPAALDALPPTIRAACVAAAAQLVAVELATAAPAWTPDPADPHGQSRGFLAAIARPAPVDPLEKIQVLAEGIARAYAACGEPA